MKLHPAGFSQQRVLCSQTQSRKVVPSCPSQLKGPIRSHRMVRSAVALDGPGTATESNPDKQPAVQLIAQDGDLLSNLDDKVQVAVAQPSYTVRILYRSRGTPLQDASDIWAHMGHSGWQYKLDVKLERQSEDPQGSYLIPIKQLSASWHLETQMVFKGLVGGHERWDNKGGSNWTVAVEVAPGVGLVQALNPTYASTRELTSSLLLRLEALVAARLLTPEQGSVLRVLAWQHDMGLIKAYQEIRNNKDERQVAGVLAGRCSWLRPPGLNVVHIASEMAPVAKVGGLADVTASLAKAHQASGLLTEIILPKYDCIKYDDVKELKKMATLHVPWGPDPNRTIETYVWSGLVDGLPVYFIEPNCSERYFWRGKFYGEPDDGARFSFFSRAALEFLAQRQHEAPDIIHCHDWQAAAVGPLLKETYRASGLARTRAVLTIHNMAFQGHLNGAFLQHMGLTPRAAHVTSPDIMLDGNAPPPAPANNSGNPYGHMWLNLLKGAIVYADRITTVSPTYANEVLGEEGKGLQHMLQRHRHKLAGVLNGLDYETWNPATDPCLPAHFTSEDLSGKRACKAAFLRELGLPFDGVLPGSNGHDSSGNGNDSGSPWGPNGRPLIAIVSRLTQQKGLHLMKAGLKAAVAAGAQVVVLGTAPDPKDQAEWEALAKEVGAGGDARIVLRHDEAMSHRIFAASDMLLVPSMFEPCGLTQLIALRYGTVPVVRETGGLADTVRDVAKAMPEHEKNGFTFTAKDAPAVEHALQRAINAYRDGRTWWQQELMPRIMRQDFGWTQSASTYQRIYNEAMH